MKAKKFIIKINVPKKKIIDGKKYTVQVTKTYKTSALTHHEAISKIVSRYYIGYTLLTPGKFEQPHNGYDIYSWTIANESIGLKVFTKTLY